MDWTDTLSLDALFEPDSIALVGASADREKLSGRPYYFLQKFGYTGDIYLVNPSHDRIDGLPCYDSVTDIPGPVDVAMVLVPAPLVPQVVEECGKHDISFAIVIASGFGETGEEGQKMEAKVAEAAREGGIRLVGPNSEGLVSLDANVAVSFSSILKRDDLQVGNVGFVSQSGAFGGAIFQLMQNLGIGANRWITTGNEADLDALDVMRYYVEDQDVDVVATYLESVERGRRLLDVGERAVATDTDIVAIRVGRSAEGQRATASHTGSIATDDAVYEAMLNQAGVTRVRSVDEFGDTVSAFSKLPSSSRPDPDEGVGVISMSGGAAALIADTCERVDLSLATLDEATRKVVRTEIPSYGSATNPVDVTGAAISDPAVFQRCITAIAADDEVGMLVLQYGNSGDETIEVCKETVMDIRATYDVPVATVFTGAPPSEATAAELTTADIWIFEDPVRAIKTFGAVSEKAGWTAEFSGDGPPSVPTERYPFPDDDWATATTTLADLGVEFAPSTSVSRTDADGAVDAAADVGYPVVCKLDPLAVAHKSDIGGVKTDLADEAALRSAFEDLTTAADDGNVPADTDVLVQQIVDGVELVVGVVDDSDFGPVMVFGPGGVFVELFKDAFSYRSLPVTEAGAREMIAESAVAPLLAGYRDVPAADVDAVASLLSAVSDAYFAYDVSEMELNPAIATPDGCIGVDLLVE